MKELYTSPEAKLTCFAPVENLASNSVTLDELFLAAGNGGILSATPGQSGDVDFPAV